MTKKIYFGNGKGKVKTYPKPVMGDNASICKKCGHYVHLQLLPLHLVNCTGD